MSICIVDDNPVNLMLVERILKNAGYPRIVTADSAAKLFNYLRMSMEEPHSGTVDLILMDLMMPEIDGIEACRRIQQVEELKDIPIIIVTALGDSNKLAEALDAGAMDYVMKPINKVELLARIRSALRLKYEKDWHKERDKHIREELELAKQVQRSVLSPPIRDDNVSIAAIYRPSFELAGDMYAWERIGEHRYSVILYDVMGHGISSSLVCMFISSVLQSAMTRITDPERVIHSLNRYMSLLRMKEQYLHYYFTAIYLVIDTREKTIEYVNAGHLPGILLEEGGKVTMLDQGTCAVGFFNQIEVRKTVIRYENPAQIALFTDGLLELFEGDLDRGIARVAELLRQGRGEQVTDAVDELIGRQENSDQQDDMCFVVIHAK